MKRRDVATIVELRRVRLLVAEQKAARLRQALDDVIRQHTVAQDALRSLAAEVATRIDRHEDARRSIAQTVGRLRVEQEYIGLLQSEQHREEASVARFASAVDACRAEHAASMREVWRCRQRLDHAMTLRSDDTRQRNRRLERIAEEPIFRSARAAPVSAS